MLNNYLKMLVFKCFICSLFLWLSFSSPQEFNGDRSIFDSHVDSITTSNSSKHQALLVRGYLETNQAHGAFKTFKLPFRPFYNEVSLPTAQSYDYKLLYLEIASTIPLKLTVKTLIFPFHFFT